LQLEQGHRFFGVVKLAGDRGAGPVAGHVRADVGCWDGGLAAEHRDDGVVDVVGGDTAGSDGEQQVDLFADAAVEKLRLGRPVSLPRPPQHPGEAAHGRPLARGRAFQGG
jgi:hypothetical protein